ncbi:hypothetical protein LC593_19775 [Nostoc sp. CHAB 5844]|nr:hypothetical protein [Nostoc sp. CHAB 5844]
MTVGKAAQRTAHRNGVASHERLPRMVSRLERTGDCGVGFRPRNRLNGEPLRYRGNARLVASGVGTPARRCSSPNFVRR